jgi:corrinoid protein of di/trimethylamine methyltransferase
MERKLKNFLEECYSAVLEGDKQKAEKLATEAVKSSYDPYLVIEKGLVQGIKKLGEKWEQGSCFLPELVLGAEAVKAGISILQEPILKSKSRKNLPRVIIGTIEGDIHDIGKTLVATMLSANGFEVIDLGVDVKSDNFVRMAKKYEPRFLCLSSLLTTTMQNEIRVIEGLKKANLRKKLKVMVGGAPASSSWAKEIGADLYAENAISAVKVAQREIGHESKRK